MKSTLFALLLTFSLNASADIGVVNVLSHVFKTKYAVQEIKQAGYGWELDKEIALLKERFNENREKPTTSLARFFSSTRDFHVGVTFISTARAILPIEVKECEGRFFLVWINESALSSTSFAACVGDELVEWDGRPVTEVVKEFLENEYAFGETTPSFRELGISYLTRRIAEIGLKIPEEKDVTLKFIQKGTGVELTETLAWRIGKENLPEFGHAVGLQSLAKGPLGMKSALSQLDRKAILPFATTKTFNHLRQESVNFAIADRRGFLPYIGTPIWVTNEKNPFFGYITKLANGKKVGVIRIPIYESEEKSIFHYESLIRKFQAETDLLVIDQMNNPGGSVLYSFSLLSYLTDKPLELYLQREALTEDEILTAYSFRKILQDVKTEKQAKEVFDSWLVGYRPTLKLAKQILGYCNFIYDQWGKGLKMTDPYPLFGIDKIDPHPAFRYTKPILVLINTLDFSCGDFFPAIMQDNKRATLMGQTTAGAGGCITSGITIPNRLGIESFSLTSTLIIRSNNQIVENQGVTPDIECPFTPVDYQENFKDFCNAVEKQIQKMLNSI